MLTDNTHRLFKFIDFLHSNIENFNQYNKVILEWKEARWKESQLSNHYKDILEKRKTLKIIEAKWSIIFLNIHTRIKDEGIFSVFVDFDANDVFFNQQFRDIFTLNHTFEETDLDKILKAKRQYIEFRNDATPNIFSLPRLKIFFERMDILMTHILEPFCDKGDGKIPAIQDIPIEDISPNPESFDIIMRPEEVKDFFDSLLIKHQEVIQEDTDYDYFAYAITGEKIPFDKLPYKPVRLIGTIENMHEELLILMTKHNVISEKSKTIPQKYKNCAEKLFLNAKGDPLKLYNPK